MAKFELKVRRMKTGESMIATLDSFDDALVFLQERPEFMEVLGVISDAASSELRRLRDAMRPYSPEERALKDELQARDNEALAAHLEKEQRLADLSAEKERREAIAKDPDRPMAVRWDLVEGFSVADPYDPRPITDAAKQAILEWIAERNTWVESRGQVVGEALVEVYPGPVPDQRSRVLGGGTFTPRLKEEG